MEKIQPFISFYNHPLKDVLWLSAAGFMCCLKALPEEMRTGNNFSTKEKVPALIKKFHNPLSVFGEESKFMAFAGDIKEMYTHLPLNIILEAIKLILGIVQRHARRSEVSVHLNFSKLNRMGKTYFI